MSNFFKGNAGDEEIKTAVSDEMSSNIELWTELYEGNMPWTDTLHPQSLGLPAAIASEIARLVTLEMEVEVKCPAKVNENGDTSPPSEAESQRADFLNEQAEPLIDNMRRYCEYACASGGIALKPYVIDDRVAIDCVQATDFKPIKFDSRGKIVDCLFVEHKKIGKYYYHRLERHEYQKGVCTFTNKAYRSMNENERGTQVSLTEVPEWAHLIPEQKIGGVKSPLFSYFRMPLGNTIDTKSHLGVSVYARAIGQIKDADLQYQRLNWEFEGGELAIEASKDVLEKDEDGNPKLPPGKERLYRTNGLKQYGGSNNAELMKTFSPTLRDESIINGLNSILQKIEFNTGLAYGTISDPQNVDKTATEIKSSKQRSYSTVSDIQTSLQNALEDLMYSVDTYATLYNLAPLGDYEIKFKWDDSIIVDSEAERARDLNDVRNGLMQKYEYRMKWYGEDEATAKEAVGAMEVNSEKKDNPFGLS